ncbi:maleylacetate reductase [Planotetraspora silvatica]|uniref:Maleylacetate reductase n=1 Tax=Planotetraspora silvatica TaxID=234614 RepID=A0A8J3XQD7_9ACTN|nr:maleylacetate reductase [Planotetraspora silvatica]GII50737.1 maleylacetate reductase [Planotetraspora silvatica]
MSFTFDHVTLGQRVLFGTGAAADNAVAAVEELGARRILLVHDAFAVALADAIAERAPVVRRIDEIVQHVPVENAERATAVAAAADVDAIVAIGGGSVTGLAKAVALRTGAPIVAIPTTFAGSEATDVWGMTKGQRKTTGVDPRVLPKVVVYDAALSAGLPTTLAVASGLNAVAHAVDGFWAPRADPINRALGTEGLRALFPGLRGLIADPGDLDAREQTLYGAYLAAVAFASAGSGLHHKICHTLGGAYNLPHAETHAIVLPYVTAFNAPFAPDAAERIQELLGVPNAAAGLDALRAELGAPASLAAIGLKESDIRRAAELALPAVPPSNPRPVTVSDLEGIMRAAWVGEQIV